MAEVTPLLTRQAWELVTPVTASGVATGSAVGGAAGLAIAAGAVLAVCAVVAFVKNRRPSKKKSPARSERRTARTGAGLFDRITGLGARRRTGTRPATNRSGGAGGSTGGARRALANLFGRFRTAPPGRGRRPASSTARSGTPTGSRPGQRLAGRFRRRSAGAGSRPGRSSNR
uniref:hypothetical protein n=1 Tax=Salmonella enterica TaxID=28901 RepID=UPI00329753F7